MSKQTFQAFIKQQLEFAKINEAHQELFTDSEGLDLFLISVTHPTFDAENNYQELEFIGDGIIKGVLSQYIPRRFPQLKGGTKGSGEGMLSKTRRFLEQRKTLSDFALNLGFWDHVRADEETKSKLRKETLEDVFEAFIGALVEIVDTRVKRGLGYNYAYNYVERCLNNFEIDINSQTLDDPITRLNELYKVNTLQNNIQPLKWGDAVYNTVQLYLPKFTTHPPKPKFGHTYFSLNDKLVYIFNGTTWIQFAKADLIPIIVYPEEPILDEEGKPTNMQSIWYAGVFGFPNHLGRTMVEKHTTNDILNNPNKYGAQIIGQGMHFKKVDAKKLAAVNALEFLLQKGYKK